MPARGGLSASSRSTPRFSAGSSAESGWARWILAHETPAGPTRSARHCPGLRAQPAGRQPADDLGQVRRRRLQPADRPALRRPLVVALRDRRQAGRASTPWRSRGPATEPSIVFIDGLRDAGPRVSWRPAGSLWGLPAARPRSGSAPTRRRLAGRGDRPGGRAADPVRHDQPRRPARRPGRPRGGAGVEADQGRRRPRRPAHAAGRPRRTVALARKLSALSFGPATEKYRELGTVANLLAFNRFDALPTRNFQAGRFEGAERLAAEDLGPARRVARNSCAACTIGCEHIYAGGSRSSGVRLEYESLFALGPLCGVDDPAAVLARRACDDAGLDTISTGATIAFLMECAEQGWIDGRLEGSGRPLLFGDGAAVLEAIAALVDRRGTTGSTARPGQPPGRPSDRRRGARPWPRTSRAWSCPATTREACTPWPWAWPSARAAPTTTARAPTRPTSPAGPTASSGGPAVRPRGDRDRGPRRGDGLADPLQVPPRRLHRPLRRGRRDARAVTGWPITADELQTVARRVVNARKCFNQREGWTASEDTLPPRLLTGQPEGGNAEGPGLARATLETMILAYYNERGWTSDGCVPNSLREELGLGEAAFGSINVSCLDRERS